MPDFSLPNDCSPESVVSGRFPVENQLNFSTSRLCLHRVGSAFAKSVFYGIHIVLS
jgi:hypothetical protein